MYELLILILLSTPTIALLSMFLKSGCYLLSFILYVNFIMFGLGIILYNPNKPQNDINKPQNDINTRYEELTSETTEKSDIKTIAKK